jgi:hypothetical protein
MKKDITKEFKVDFIGIGAPKAGTTWVSECLKEHPEVCFSNRKETNFFLSENFSRGNSWYQKHFNHCVEGKKKGEFSPNYLYDSAVPENIKKHSPNAKLIVILRDPVKRLESALLFEHSMGRYGNKTPQEVFNENKKFYLEKGLYYKHLTPFFNTFPKEQVLVLMYEDIEKDPLLFIQNIFRFIGIDSTFIPKNLLEKHNVTGTNRLRVPFINKTIYRLRKNLLKNTLFVKILKFLRINKLARIILNLNRRDAASSLKKSTVPIFDPVIREWIRNYYATNIKLKK